MRHKLVFWFVLLIAGFLVGFILQYARLQRLQKELSASTKQLGSCQSSEQLSQLRDKATMMYLEAVQKNYGVAGEYAKEFLILHSASYFVTPSQPAIRSRAI